MFVGNTGYGYGDTELVALSERLMTLFARRLDGALSVGEALQYAKAEYAADLTAYGVYDEKALMEATFYGLPFYRLDVANPPPVPPLPAGAGDQPRPDHRHRHPTIEVTPIPRSATGDDGETYCVVDRPDDRRGADDRRARPPGAAPRGDELRRARRHRGARRPGARADHHRPARHRAVHLPARRRRRRRARDVDANAVFPSQPVRVNPQRTPAGETFS